MHTWSLAIFGMIFCANVLATCFGQLFRQFIRWFFGQFFGGDLWGNPFYRNYFNSASIRVKVALILFLLSCSKSLHEILYLAILSAKITLQKPDNTKKNLLIINNLYRVWWRGHWNQNNERFRLERRWWHYISSWWTTYW